MCIEFMSFDDCDNGSIEKMEVCVRKRLEERSTTRASSRERDGVFHRNMVSISVLGGNIALSSWHPWPRGLLATHT